MLGRQPDVVTIRHASGAQCDGSGDRSDGHHQAGPSMVEGPADADAGDGGDDEPDGESRRRLGV